MIRYSLRCDQDHAFDAWFRNSTAYDEQVAASQVICPECGSIQVEKALMTPSVPTKTPATKSDGPREFFNQVRQYRKKVLAETEDVGRAFPTQAREMHDGDIEARPIRGQATQDEVKSLNDDGIPVLPVPPEPPAEN